jgi:hypothetical protein
MAKYGTSRYGSGFRYGEPSPVGVYYEQLGAFVVKFQPHSDSVFSWIFVDSNKPFPDCIPYDAELATNSLMVGAFSRPRCVDDDRPRSSAVFIESLLNVASSFFTSEDVHASILEEQDI